jgi:DNA-binding SARP family transcriptional activator
VLNVRLLGGLRAAVDGRAVELPADARARELLGWLALSPGLHARSALAGRLRPDVAEEHARKTLRDAVYELRRALGPGARDLVVATRDRVGLAGEGVAVDVREFRRLRAAGELEAAAERGAGELLAGLDAEWALRARDEHAADLGEVLAALAARARDAGDLPGAVAWARRRAELDPLAEEPHRDLVGLLAAGGDRAAALTAAAAFAERLRRELGVPPSAATRALVDGIRRGDVAAPAGAPAAGAAPLPALPVPLARTAPPAGRERALASLEAAFADVATGGLRVAVVTGEPGIGKTTLAGELARRVHARGGAVLYGRCDEQLLLPYGSWVEALERLLAELPPEDAERWLALHDGALARLLPGRAPAGAGPPGLPRERHLAFEVVRRLLEATAARRPLLLVLDDLHWADEDALGLLRHLARAAPAAPMLVLLCARDAELTLAGAATVAELRREGPVTGVALEGLDDEAVAAVVCRESGAADARAIRRLRPPHGRQPVLPQGGPARRARAGGRGPRPVPRRPRRRRPPARPPGARHAGGPGLGRRARPRVRRRDGRGRGGPGARRGARGPRRRAGGRPRRPRGGARAPRLRARARGRGARGGAAGVAARPAAPADGRAPRGPLRRGRRRHGGRGRGPPARGGAPGAGGHGGRLGGRSRPGGAGRARPRGGRRPPRGGPRHARACPRPRAAPARARGRARPRGAAGSRALGLRRGGRSRARARGPARARPGRPGLRRPGGGHRGALAHAEPPRTSRRRRRVPRSARPSPARARDARDRAGRRERPRASRGGELARARATRALARAGWASGAWRSSSRPRRRHAAAEEALGALPAASVPRRPPARPPGRRALLRRQDRRASSVGGAGRARTPAPGRLTAALNARRVALWDPADVEERLERSTR